MENIAYLLWLIGCMILGGIAGQLAWIVYDDEKSKWYYLLILFGAAILWYIMYKLYLLHI